MPAEKKRRWKGYLCCLIITAFLSGGCGRQENIQEPVSQEPIVHFKGVILGTPPEGGMAEVYEQLDALTIPELNCTLRFEFIPWGNEREQLNIAVASGEYDFLPGGVFSDYRLQASKNAFLDLNPYLELVPELQAHYATYSETALQDCEIAGGLYGIPQFGMGTIKDINEGFFYREDLRKEWGLPEITDLESMEAYLYRAKEDVRYRDSPLITDNRIWQSLWLMLTEGRYLEINSMQETPFVVVSAENPFQVLNRLETPEFKQVVEYINKWRQDGILAADLLAATDNEGVRGKSMMMADDKPCETNMPDWNVASDWIPDFYDVHPDWEYGFFNYVSVNEEWYIGSLADSSVISVSSKTQAPETAVRLLEKIHTDQRYYDLLKYGVEGIHHKREGEYISMEGIPSSRQFGWSVCTDELLERETVPVNLQWRELEDKKLNVWKKEAAAEAKPYPLNGFSFLAGGLGQSLEGINQAKLQYFQPLVCGYSEDAEQGVEDTIEAMKAAGLDIYIEEMQRQITEWSNK